MVIAALFFFLGRWWLFGAESKVDARPVYFTVYAGESTRSVAERLTEVHLMHTSLGFIWLAEHQKWAGDIRPGTYRLRANDTPQQILIKMVRGQAVDQISVPDGIRVTEVIQRLEAAHIGTPSQYAILAKHPLPGMPKPMPGVRNALEGYLYPATYAVLRGSTALEAISLMWSTFESRTRELSKQLPAGWTIRKWVTLASIVQAEVPYPSDDSRVAAVFLNRLKRHMRLQSDATVYYALGNRIRGPLTAADLLVRSPYNTYQVAGLPPGPIDNPGPQALYAVLHPADVGDLYFVTGPNGHAVFASSYAQQLRNIRALAVHSKHKL